jgi:cell filamentation protein
MSISRPSKQPSYMDDRKRIEQQEGVLTFARIAELERKPVEGKFDSLHLREIHRRIFQDLPHHAPGEYRPVAPSHVKNRELESSGYRYHVYYAHRSQIDGGVEKVLSEFGGPDTLRGLSIEHFSERMAKLYGDLDYLHPFKEGNSRTLRAFTRQLAKEAGYDFNWNATNANADSRDRLYIARDKEVIQRSFPGLDQERAMKTNNRDEYEAYELFLEPFAKADTLRTLIKESAYQLEAKADTSNQRMAESFAKDSPEEAVKKHPELAGAAALAAAMDKKAQTDGLSPAQREVVAARVRQNLANSIERGDVPSVQIREDKQVKAEKQQKSEPEPER